MTTFSTRRAPSPPSSGPVGRRGFTLVELMVVVGIIAVLLALMVPAVVRARSAARTAVIRKELDQLHQAMMNYGNKYGEFPPAWAPNILISGTIPLPVSDPATEHLKRVFPRFKADMLSRGSIKNLQAQAAALTYRGAASPFRACERITPGEALTLWLSGYVGENTVYTINNNVFMPVCWGGFQVVSGTVVGPVSGTRVKLFDFDTSRISSDPANNGAYCPPRCPGSPYVYIDAANYGSASSPTPYAVVTGTGATTSTTTYMAEVLGTVSGTPVFFNADTFQILCAGQDGIWPSDDDLSNFWKGTRRQYQESGR